MICASSFSWAFDLGLGAFRPDEKVQGSGGGEKTDPTSPAISIGHDWNIFGYDFAPRFGYISNQSNSDDSYGKYKVETIYVLYNFRKTNLLRNAGTSLLYGLGSFSKRITGEGGTVTIPNGAGTATAYQPDGTKTSTSLSANIGIDYRWLTMGRTIEGYGFQAMIYALQPLNNQKRVYALSAEALFLF